MKVLGFFFIKKKYFLHFSLIYILFLDQDNLDKVNYQNILKVRKIIIFFSFNVSLF